MTMTCWVRSAGEWRRGFLTLHQVPAPWSRVQLSKPRKTCLSCNPLPSKHWIWFLFGFAHTIWTLIPYPPMGETQEEPIMQFLEENEEAVVGLREGLILRVQEGAVVLGGPTTARIFRRGEKPIEATAGSDIRPLVEKMSPR
jgi:hypothetical protein